MHENQVEPRRLGVRKQNECALQEGKKKKTRQNKTAYRGLCRQN